jgi:choloylglycine hydrolase
MDGINEKGLFVSIMRLDIKEGDRPARMGVAASMLLRYMLDDCANVEEAVAKVDTAFVTPEDWQSCHFFVTDAEGRYMVIESRNGVVSLIENDVVTNFYLSSDDMQDSVRKGVLREKAVALVDENGETLYRFGYGHGYHRFVTLASQLVRYQDKRYEEYRTMMPEETALVLLRSALQNQYTEATGTSFTQYSVIYNNTHRTVKVWPFQNYNTAYMFDVTGAQLQ